MADAKTDMNKLLRRAAFGVPEEELDEYLKTRERQRNYKSMNHLLRAARVIEVIDDEESK
jgi:hypothetical protein